MPQLESTATHPRPSLAAILAEPVIHPEDMPTDADVERHLAAYGDRHVVIEPHMRSRFKARRLRGETKTEIDLWLENYAGIPS